MNLFDIKDPTFLKTLSIKELESLAKDIRAFLIESITRTGGHLSSNLGTVELIIALHYVFDSPKDVFVFDVGHQAYTHKILTGRIHQFDQLRQTDGLSGYIHYQESVHDQWESGHAGTALSALSGILHAKRMKQEEGLGIAIIGDASITNGMAFEGLNLLGSDSQVQGIIVLNDNEMGISKSVGSFSKLLLRFRSTTFYYKMMKWMIRLIPKFLYGFFSRIKRGIRGFLQRKNIFEDLGYVYVGPTDGHDLKSLIYHLTRAKSLKRSVVFHILTDKGKGHQDAEKDRIGFFHGISKPSSKERKGLSWSALISRILDDLQKDLKTFVIMPAMEVGSQFVEFAKKYPDRYLDVGIAEEHAATMAAAMAHRGIPVFLPLYSTFSQRAFDQILNDIARSNHHVVIGIDRAGIVGEDGSTHQGLFDVSMFYMMPNTVIAMPYHAKEALDLIHYAFKHQNHPFIIRYPRGWVDVDLEDSTFKPQSIEPTWNVLLEGDEAVVIGYGPSLNLVLDAQKQSKKRIKVVNARFIKPMDEAMLHGIMQSQLPILVYEEQVNTGSLYPQILAFMAQHRYTNKIQSMALSETIVTHGKYKEVLKKYHMDQEAIVKTIHELTV